MRKSYTAAVFSSGLAGVSAWALLFRQYMIALDGRDTAIGLFFAMSFIWMALGAGVLVKSRPLRMLFEGAPDLLLLTYVPTIFVTYCIIVFLRGVTGAESHSVAAFLGVLGYSLLATAPVCLLAGLTASTSKQWATDSQDPPDPRAYTLAAGGAVGGIGTTALLSAGATVASLLVALAAITSGAAVLTACTALEPGRSPTRKAFALLVLVAVAALGVSRGDVVLTRAAQQRQWSQAVPGGSLEGGFSTAQAEYLYGADANSWTVTRNGRLFETIGEDSPAGAVVAVALAQNTQAERALVIGSGLSTCAELLKSSKITAVEYFVPDQQYAEALPAHLPQTAAISDPRFNILTGDLRGILAANVEGYDVVLVNVTSATSAAAGPLLSAEFFEQVRGSLATMGLLVVNLPRENGGDNAEPAYIGASVKSTLDSTFAQTVLASSADRVFFVSAPALYLEISPIMLEIRFGLVEEAASILPPERLSSICSPTLASELLVSYDAAALPPELANSDEVPGRYLAQLLRGAHSLGIPLNKSAGSLLRGGLTILLIFVGIFALVRLAYVVATTPRQHRGFDPNNSSALQAETLTLTGGSILAGTATFLALTYLFQGRYGSLHLHLGLFLGLASLGLALGLAVAGHATALRSSGVQRVYLALSILLVGLLLQTACLAGAGSLVTYASMTHVVMAIGLVLTGLFCGVALGAGGAVLEVCRANGQAVAPREMLAASTSAALGSVLAGFFLIPLLGSQLTFYVVAALLLGNLLSLVGVYRHVARPGRRRTPHPVFSPVGYGLFALAVCVIVGSHYLSYLETSKAKSQASAVLDEWAQGRTVSVKTTVVEPDAPEVVYHEIREGSRLVGYVFRSEHFSDTVYGYAGPMAVAAFTDPNGTLIDFRVTRQRETPRYYQRITSWLETLKGKPTFGSESMAGVATVSGATRSSEAVLRLLRNSGQQFSASVFGQHEMTEAVAGTWMDRINKPLACWGGIALVALIAIYHGRLWSRLAVLGLTVGVAGFWLNRQFSTDHITRLVGAEELLAGSAGSLCLLLGVPLLILLFGNLYCGYLCPFGALQELFSLITPKRFKARLSLRAMTAGRSVKYVVLFVLVVTFVVVESGHLLRGDPLTSFFDRTSWSIDALKSIAVIVAIVMLLGTLFVTRLWCRYLCPTGAFLSLFNRIAPLKRLLPAKKFGRCEFGLSGRDNFDCIHCDRCRYQSRLIPARHEVIADSGSRLRSWLFLAIVLAAAAVVASPALRKAPPASPAPATEIAASQTAPSVSPTIPGRRQTRRRGR